jgi:hypothetical protein
MTVDRDAALAGLRPAERARLDGFSRVFKRLDASAYPIFAERPDGGIRDIQERAIELIGRGPRRDAIRAAVDAFLEAGSYAYRDRQEITTALLPTRQVADRADDRVRFLASVDRAVVSLILWDELTPEDRLTLLGPWSRLLDSLGLDEPG